MASEEMAEGPGQDDKTGPADRRLLEALAVVEEARREAEEAMDRQDDPLWAVLGL